MWDVFFLSSQKSEKFMSGIVKFAWRPVELLLIVTLAEEGVRACVVHAVCGREWSVWV